MSYKDQRELSLLPARIEALESAQKLLQGQIADPAWFRADPERATAGWQRLQALEADLSAAYERWDALESLQP